MLWTAAVRALDIPSIHCEPILRVMFEKGEQNVVCYGRVCGNCIYQRVDKRIQPFK